MVNVMQCAIIANHGGEITQPNIGMDEVRGWLLLDEVNLADNSIHNENI